MTILIDVLNIIFDAVRWVIIAQFVVSLLITFNVANNSSIRSIAYGLDQVTEPLYRPIRRVLPSAGGIDFSPLVVLVLMQIIQRVLFDVAINAAVGG